MDYESSHHAARIDRPLSQPSPQAVDASAVVAEPAASQAKAAKAGKKGAPKGGQKDAKKEAKKKEGKSKPEVRWQDWRLRFP